MSSLLSLSPLRRRWLLDYICWANLAEVVCHHALEPVHFVWHITVCPLKNVESVVDALRTLLSHHAKTNSPLPDERHHMVFEHVEFWRDRCFRESSTIVPDELVDVANYMYKRYVQGWVCVTTPMCTWDRSMCTCMSITVTYAEQKECCYQMHWRNLGYCGTWRTAGELCQTY